jgi:RNA polymerase sigma factor (sigma-70 family)
MAEFDVSDSLTAAARGDQRAWDLIVQQYSGMVWAVARSYRLASADAADVFQATWLRLVEHLADLRDGSRLGAWLCTTARHEALTLLRRRRDLPASDTGLLDGVARDGSGLDEGLLRNEERAALWRAFGLLPGNCQRLLRVIFADPPPSYAEASAVLDIPVGSIGPTRARCLASLQALLSSTAVG